jgi:lipopolysaccharide/colanic/teichoic acid biosynthesis glycosyltransferase
MERCAMATTANDKERERTLMWDEAGAFTFTDWRELPRVARAGEQTRETANVSVGPMERIAAVLLLILLSPLMLLIALAIKFEFWNGPILYCQERVGLDRRRAKEVPHEFLGRKDRRRVPGVGEIFRICKFRTMIPNAEGVTGPVWASNNDPRVTRVGKVLRHLRLDELPQLVNVVQGQMRLIGPRPERPCFVENLTQQIPEYARRQTVPPGITGLAQIEREYDVSVDDVRTKVKYDLFYVTHRSLMMDFKILLRTIDVMVRGRGAH